MPWQAKIREGGEMCTIQVKLIDHVSKEMESGKTPENVYIGLSKAYDTLTFDILLYKLKYYGLTAWYCIKFNEQLPEKSKTVCCV